MIAFHLGNPAKLSLDHFMPDIQIHKWVETFQHYKFDKLTFEPLFKRALLILKDAWLRCIKEDVDHFTSAYYLTGTPSQSVNESEEEDDDEDEDEGEAEPQGKQPPLVSILKKPMQQIRVPTTQIQLSNDMIYIKRPWINRFVPSAPTERQERLLEALDNAMTDEERQRLRAERLERLRKIEENRKKALKAARERRQKQAQEKESNAVSEKNSQQRRRDAGFYIDRVLPSKTTTISKDVQRLLLGNFQRHVRSSKTAPSKFEQKLSFVFEMVKVIIY